MHHVICYLEVRFFVIFSEDNQTIEPDCDDRVMYDAQYITMYIVRWW